MRIGNNAEHEQYEESSEVCRLRRIGMRLVTPQRACGTCKLHIRLCGSLRLITHLCADKPDFAHIILSYLLFGVANLLYAPRTSSRNSRRSCSKPYIYILRCRRHSVRTSNGTAYEYFTRARSTISGLSWHKVRQEDMSNTLYRHVLRLLLVLYSYDECYLQIA